MMRLTRFIPLLRYASLLSWIAICLAGGRIRAMRGHSGVLSGSRPAQASAGTGPQESQTAGSEGANAALWERAKSMYGQNDFAQASAAAGHITSPALKHDAQTMVQQIREYTAALQDGSTAEADAQHDPVAAIKAYAVAARIKSDGPGDPNARIARIQQMAAAGATATQQAEKDKNTLRQARLAQGHARATQLVTKAIAQETTGDLSGALGSFAAAQAAEPTNSAAVNGLGRVRGKIAVTGNHASVAGPDAAPGIRDFYAGEYQKAEGELSAVFAQPNAPARGAVCFYLGATRFYRALLEAGQPPETAAQRPEVQAAFKQARALGYVPLPQFVSPALMAVWQGVS